VDEVFGPARPAGLRITVVQGNAAHVLIEASRDARMLVVGSRGHGAFAGMVLGSVSQHCVQHMTCPVVVVPSTET
jgi:nucleotide-binding universal stress UspA family protein